MPDAPSSRSPSLCAGYGQSQVLEDVSFSMGVESVAIIGRNGMGKSTLCNTLIGLLPTTSGTVVLGGTTLPGRHPERIAQAGIAYVPQGRRLFPPLTVDEHIAMLAKGARRQALDARRRVRAVPPPRPTPPQPRRRPVRRRAADARRRPGAAAQRLAA